MVFDEHYDLLNEFKSCENKICWQINNLCNFKCEYCFFPYYDEENPDVAKYSHKEILKAFDDTGRKWNIFISGGEPLLYPNFSELVNTVGPHHPIQISSNLYNKYVKEFANTVDPSNISVINASLHIGHHSEKSVLQFLRNYHLFLEKGFKIIVSYVTFPPLFSRIKDDFRFLKEQGVKQVVPLTYFGVHEGKPYPGSYTRDQVEILFDLTKTYPLERLNFLNKMEFKNKRCTAGQNFFFMNIQGDVSSCGTIGKPMGNLFEGTFKPNTSPMICTADNCNDNWLGILSLVDEPEIPETITFTGTPVQ